MDKRELRDGGGKGKGKERVVEGRKGGIGEGGNEGRERVKRELRDGGGKGRGKRHRKGKWEMVGGE